MPALNVDRPGASAVNAFGDLLVQLLDEASSAKTETTVEPALIKSDFEDLTSRVDATLPQQSEGAEDDASAAEALKGRQFAVVEGAARDLFDSLIATISIDSPGFVRMWNFFDILSFLSDDGQCDPALLFWLVEELLDSQTIAGCRHIFDYLESRRERITVKNFKQKQLVILRSCNELLRRLSRAEDTAFCGRVFIFMFQCFPLGDRSSVNLRGEYHVENITSYEATAVDQASKMDVDTETTAAEGTGGKEDTNSTKTKEAEKRLTAEELYPLFWSLQESFSQPMRLFDSANFAEFKNSLEATMKAFEALHADDQRGQKRKRSDEDAENAPETFNPKYLTSSDLFELEISDLSFRRHVLVQALIIDDLLLSLSPEAKQKLATLNASNKSVIYAGQLSEENTKWATDMKKRISEYLKKGFDGPYFYRMVETVLARDKNWVFWKMASCPPIQKDPVSPADFVEARSSAQRMATSKRLRPVPMGAVSLDFLHSSKSSRMEELSSTDRYQLPELESFKRPIADDDFEIEMPTNDATMAAAVAGKASKSWRALRIAGRSRLAAFDRIDDPKNIAIVFEEPTEDDGNTEDGLADGPTAGDDEMPASREPLIIAGPRGVGKSALVAKMLEKRKGVFGSVVRHTTRQPQEGEVAGKTFHFVPAAEFNQLRDGDRLVEYTSREDGEYGTSTKAIEAVSETGKIPIIELDIEAAQFAKDMDFVARYALLKPPSTETLASRLTQAGVDEAAAKDIAAKAEGETAGDEVFGCIVVNDELDAAVEAVDDFVYEPGEGEGEETEEGDETMEDADAGAEAADAANGEENEEATEAA